MQSRPAALLIYFRRLEGRRFGVADTDMDIWQVTSGQGFAERWLHEEISSGRLRLTLGPPPEACFSLS